MDKRSFELTARTHLGILISWLVIGLGILTSFGIASYFLQVDVVNELWSVRDSIQALAAGDLERPIPFLNRPNEIGEISRSLHTLKDGARDRETQAWVKAEVASTGVRLQSARDFAAFSSTLLIASRSMPPRRSSRRPSRVPARSGLPPSSTTKRRRPNSCARTWTVNCSSRAIRPLKSPRRCKTRWISVPSNSPPELIAAYSSVGWSSDSASLHRSVSRRTS
ncbi:MAG: hypothetical protein DMG81_04775, partial [Acidobacteria bacterium]